MFALSLWHPQEYVLILTTKNVLSYNPDVEFSDQALCPPYF